MFPHFHLVRNNLGEAKMTISLRGSPGLIISMDTESRHKSNKKGFYFLCFETKWPSRRRESLGDRNLFFKSCTFITGSVKSPEIGSPQDEVESGVSRAIQKENAVSGNFLMLFQNRRTSVWLFIWNAQGAPDSTPFGETPWNQPICIQIFFC